MSPFSEAIALLCLARPCDLTVANMKCLEAIVARLKPKSKRKPKRLHAVVDPIDIITREEDQLLRESDERAAFNDRLEREY